jgi:hypothetical protein
VPSSSRDLIVRILADTSKLNAGVNETNSKLGGLGKAAKVAGSAFAAFAAADVAVDFLQDATKAAEEDKKSQALLANQLKETNNATEDQIDTVEDNINALSRLTGVADDDLRPAYAALARSTGDTEQANRELAIAMDIAAGRGVDLATVTAAMEKAHNGNIGALGRLGVATKDAEGNTLSLEEAMAKASETYKGAAEAAVTPGQRMSVAFNELKEQVGTALLPVLENLSTFMADTLLPAFQDAIVWIQTHWPEIEKAISDTFNKLKPIIETFVGVIQTQWAIVSGVFQTISDLLHGHWSEAWHDFANMLSGVWDGIVKIVKGHIDAVKELFGGLVSWIGELPGKIASVAAGMWDGLWDALVGVIDKIRKAIRDLFSHIGIHIHEGLGPLPDVNFDWQLPIPPGLKDGGTVAKTGLAIVHQGETFSGVGGGGMGGVTITGPVTIYPASMTDEAVVKAVYNWSRRNNGLRVPGGVTAVS